MANEVNGGGRRFLVTGASSFIGLQIILLLLEKGYSVRATMRDLRREAEIRLALREVTGPERLELVHGDLRSDAGWNDAASGVDGVFHVASPVPRNLSPREDELVVPARDGTLRVLRAARQSGVPRVVLTSSVAAITTGHAPRARAFDEADWSVVEGAPPYEKSKTIAERAAWDFVREEGSLSLVVINPTFVLGPLITPKVYSSSLDLIRKMMAHKMHAIPDVNLGLVDVRDVASAHLEAMLRPEADGHRYICSSATWPLIQVARVLQAYVAPRGMTIPTRRASDFAVRAVAIFDPKVGFLVPRLGRWRELDTTRIRAELGFKPRTVNATIVDTADSLLAMRIVR